MRKRPSIASVYLVSVSHQCIASVPTFETIHPSFFTPHPSDFDGLEAASSAPSGINVVRSVARNVARDVARVSLVMSLVMWGGCDSMNILLERDRHPFLHQS